MVRTCFPLAQQLLEPERKVAFLSPSLIPEQHGNAGTVKAATNGSTRRVALIIPSTVLLIEAMAKGRRI
jgi:hypothetical protein